MRENLPAVGGVLYVAVGVSVLLAIAMSLWAGLLVAGTVAVFFTFAWLTK